RIDAGADGAAGERRNPAGNFGDDAVWNFPGIGALAFGGAGAAASFGHVFEAGFARRRTPGAGGDHFYILVRGPVRQRGHAGGRVRAGRLRQGREDSTSGTRVAGGWRGNDVWRADGNFDGDQLYRECRGSSGGGAHRTEQHYGGGT